MSAPANDPGRRVACARPCRACPWRTDTHVAEIPGFRLTLAEDLAASCASPDGRGTGPAFGAPVFACHESRPGAEIACAGWLATDGHRHPGVRLMVQGGRVDAAALEPREGWPELHPSYAAMMVQLREQFADEAPAVDDADDSTAGR